MSVSSKSGGEGRRFRLRRIGVAVWVLGAMLAFGVCRLATAQTPDAVASASTDALSPAHAALSPAAAALSPAETAAELEKARIQLQDLQVEVVRLKDRLRAALQWKLVREMEEEVSRIRRLPLKKRVDMATLSPEATRQLVDRLINADLPAVKAIPIQRTLILLGALPPGTDLRRMLINLFSEQVGGLYDDTTGKLYVTEQFDPEGAMGRIVLAHEICHAIQDQNFDLSRYPIHITDNDDRAYAASSALEGDATVLMTHYMMENLSLSWLVDLPKAMSVDQKQFNAAPPYLQYLLIFPYLEGMNLILAAEGVSPDARDALLRNPPRTTEQVIHPDKYFSRDYEGAVDVETADLSAALGPGWSMRAQNTYGEQGIRGILMHDKPIRLKLLSTKPLDVDPKIVEAAEGWGGDRVAIWMKDEAAEAGADRSGSNTGGELTTKDTEHTKGAKEIPAVVHWRTVWDTDRDAYEFRRYAVETWLPSLLPNAKEAVLSNPDNARAWTADNDLWARIQWDGKQVDLLIGQSKETESLMTKDLPR